MRWAMLAVMAGWGALMGAAPAVPGTSTPPAPAAPTFVGPGGRFGGGNIPALDPPLPGGSADDIAARMAQRRQVPGTGAAPAPAAPAFIYPAEGGGGSGSGPLPPEMSVKLQARMQARRLVEVAQVLAMVSMGVAPENMTVTTSTIEAESTAMPQGGVGVGGFGSGGFGTSGGNPGGGRGFGATTAPAGPARGGPMVFGPSWSNEVNGLRIEGWGNPYMTPQIPLIVRMEFQCALADEEEICPDDPACWNWEVRDAANRVMPSVNVPVEGGAARWSVCSSAWGSLVDGPRSDRTETNVLVAGARRWKLAPGEYTLRGTYRGPSQLPREHPEIPAWTGKIDLVPLTFTVYGTVTPEELAKAAAAVRGQKWADKGEMYRALAKLVQPGMSGAELLSVLPKGMGEDAKWGQSGGAGSGPIMASRGTYALDADYGVEWSGGGMVGVEGVKVLSMVPRVVTKQEYEQARQPAGRAGRGRAGGGGFGGGRFGGGNTPALDPPSPGLSADDMAVRMAQRRQVQLEATLPGSATPPGANPAPAPAAPGRSGVP